MKLEQNVDWAALIKWKFIPRSISTHKIYKHVFIPWLNLKECSRVYLLILNLNHLFLIKSYFKPDVVIGYGFVLIDIVKKKSLWSKLKISF